MSNNINYYCYSIPPPPPHNPPTSTLPCLPSRCPLLSTLPSHLHHLPFVILWYIYIYVYITPKTARKSQCPRFPRFFNSVISFSGAIAVTRIALPQCLCVFAPFAFASLFVLGFSANPLLGFFGQVFRLDDFCYMWDFLNLRAFLFDTSFFIF